jgi:cytoskeleton protein RodZ
VLPLRDISQPTRVDVRLEPREPEAKDGEIASDPADRHQDAVQVLEVGEAGILIDDLADPGAAGQVNEPVIGPKITRARECLDMSIDELSQRTRIRPHVLEAIEQDDFVPCGGDFYARGHLTAVSRALGLTLAPLLAQYDERYAQAPINARRVFEAELSGGLGTGTRSPLGTMGGPKWSLLIGCVLALTMIWGLARIFAGAPEQLTAAPDNSQTAGLVARQTPITSPLMKTTTMTVRAAFASAHVVVKDRTGTVLWSGDLTIGNQRKIIGLTPFTVSSDNAGAIAVTVKGKQLGVIGTAGAPGSKSFR